MTSLRIGALPVFSCAAGEDQGGEDGLGCRRLVCPNGMGESHPALTLEDVADRVRRRMLIRIADGMLWIGGD